MVDHDGSCLSAIDPSSGTQPLGPSRRCLDVYMAGDGVSAEGGGFVAVIESRMLLRERIRRSLQSALSMPVITYSNASELERQPGNASALLIILSLADGDEESTKVCKFLSESLPEAPVIVLAGRNDANLARAFINCGAKGYIPWTMGFETAVAAARFVLAGREGESMLNTMRATLPGRSSRGGA